MVMKLRLAVLLVMLHSPAVFCLELPDESAMAPLIADLKSEKPEVRETAAAALRTFAASNQNAVEQAGEYWKSKLTLIKTGMISAEVHKALLPWPAQPQSMGVGGGRSHSESYRLDYHWSVTVYYNNPDSVQSGPPVLSKSEIYVWVEPPAKFSGKWTCWHSNGEKAYDIDYKDGNRDGLFIAYYDNGKKCYEQEVRNGQTGHDWGWHPDGTKSYVGQYKDGKQDGQWTWWYPDGKKKSEKFYKDGVLEGADLSWFENGKQQYEFNYQGGKRIGREASWDEKGTLLYEHQHDSGK